MLCYKYLLYGDDKKYYCNLGADAVLEKACSAVAANSHFFPSNSRVF